MPETLKTSDTTLIISRVLDAPRDKVFAAWTQPDLLKQWWGPPGFTVPRAELDLRPKGSYCLDMRTPDGEAYVLTGTFVEVRPPEKLVYTWAWDEDEGRGHESQVTVEFKAAGSKTEVVITHERLANAESRDKHLHGWGACLDNLQRLVAGRAIKVSLTIDAPAGAVFRAITDDRELERWWPTAARSELRKGGAYNYDFLFDDAGKNLEQNGEFLEVTPNTCVRYTWPATAKDYITEVRWDLTEQSGTTTVVVTNAGFGQGPEWDESFEGHKSGWKGFLDNLKSVLEGGPDHRRAMGMKTKV